MGATSTRRNTIIERSYAPEEKTCAQAIEVLLKESLTSKGGGPATASNDAVRRSSDIGATDKFSK